MHNEGRKQAVDTAQQVLAIALQKKWVKILHECWRISDLVIHEKAFDNGSYHSSRLECNSS